MDMTHKNIEGLFYNQIRVLTLNSFKDFKERRRQRLETNNYFKSRRV